MPQYGFLKKSDGSWPDPPHVATLALNSIAVVFSAIALVLSAMGYLTAGRSLEVAQRAYVSAKTTRFEIVRTNSLRSVGGVPGIAAPPDTDANNSLGDVFVDFAIEIENLGNTPATLNSITVNFVMPAGWKFVVPWTGPDIRLNANGNTVNVTNLPSLGRNKSIVKAVRMGLELLPEAQDKYLSMLLQTMLQGRGVAGIPGPLTANVELRYSDQFTEMGIVRWCGVNQMHSPEPLECLPASAP